jgi:hypothetical protein
MTQPPKASRAGFGRRSASPAERGEEFAAHQRRLKEEAAERRLRAPGRTDAAPPSGRRQGRKGRG